MDRNTNSGYGDSVACGNTRPSFLRDPLFREIYENRFCFWTVMA